MNLKWPGSTNKGTALLKLLHQREQRVLVRDDYIGWYLESESIEISQKPFAGIVDLGESPEQKFQRIAYWFTEIREKYFDDIIKAAIEDQCKQLVLLGAGYDTRYLRLQILHDEMVSLSNTTSITNSNAKFIVQPSMKICERLYM